MNENYTVTVNTPPKSNPIKDAVMSTFNTKPVYKEMDALPTQVTYPSNTYLPQQPGMGNAGTQMPMYPQSNMPNYYQNQAGNIPQNQNIAQGYTPNMQSQSMVPAQPIIPNQSMVPTQPTIPTQNTISNPQTTSNQNMMPNQMTTPNQSMMPSQQNMMPNQQNTMPNQQNSQLYCDTTEPTPDNLASMYYTPGFLQQYLGRLMRVEFIIGNTLTDKVGILSQVGASYIVLQIYNTDTFIMCDLYAIRFATILNKFPPASLYPNT